jgi:hypothetical protein
MGSSGSSLKYEPQPSLQGLLELDDDETLVATFKFEAAEWETFFGLSKEYTVGVGMVEGLGHVTSERLILFWDLKGALRNITDHGTEWTCMSPF